MALSLHEKVSVAEARQWLLTAHEEWTGKHTDSLTDEELSEFDSQIAQMKPVDFKAPRKPRSSKKSTPDSERINAQYDESKCDARIWLKGGYDAQCSCCKVDGQFFCKKHQNEADANGGATKNGSFNVERPTHHYGDESNKLIPWHDVVIEKTSKGGKQAPTGTRKERVCGCCGEAGHDKRKCPKNTAKSAPMTAAEAVAAAEATLAAAKEAAAKEAATKETTAQETSTVESSPNEPPSPIELDEDHSEINKDGGAGVGFSTSVEDTGYQSDTTEAYVSQSEEEMSGHTACPFEGVKYWRNVDGIVVDDDDDEPAEVGKWDDGAIVFTSIGRRLHGISLASL